MRLKKCFHHKPTSHEICWENSYSYVPPHCPGSDTIVDIFVLVVLYLSFHYVFISHSFWIFILERSPRASVVSS